MEGFPSLCAILLGRKGWFSGQCCTVDMVAVAMLCPGCVAPTVLSTGAGQGQGIPYGVWMIGFYVGDMPAIPQSIPILPAQQVLGVSGTLDCFGTREVVSAGLRPMGTGDVCMGWNGEKKKSVGAFSLETSPGLSGTHVPLVFLHILSVVPAGAWLQGAGIALCSQPSSHPSTLRAREGAWLCPPELQPAGEGPGQWEPQAAGSGEAQLCTFPVPHKCAPLSTSNASLVSATLLFLSPLWPPASPGKAGDPSPSLPCVGQTSLRIKKSCWPDLCPGCILQDPALLSAWD